MKKTFLIKPWGLVSAASLVLLVALCTILFFRGFNTAIKFNGQEISKTDYKEAYNQYLVINKDFLNNPDSPDKQKQDFIKYLGDLAKKDSIRKMAVNEALKSLNISADESKVNSEVTKYKELIGNDKAPDELMNVYINAMNDEKSLDENLKSSFVDKVLISYAKENFIREYYRSMIVLSDDDLKKYYEENRFQFLKTPHAETNIQRIVVKDMETGNEVYAKLKAGEDFNSLLKEYTLAEIEKKYDGNMAIRTYSQYENVVADAIFNLKAGEFSKPLKTNMGIEIIKVLKKDDVTLLSFDEARDAVREMALKEHSDKELEKCLDDIIKKSNIVYRIK